MPQSIPPGLTKEHFLQALTDLDGGIDSRYGPIQDLGEIKGLPGRLRKHFSAAQVDGIMGENWLDFLGRSLPPPSPKANRPASSR